MKKKLATLILTSSILAASLTAPFTASADELTDKIQETEQKVNELNNRVNSAEAVLSQVQAEITATENRANDLLEQRVVTQEEITVLNEEIARLQEVIEQREEQLKEQARSVQVNGSNKNYINFVFGSESLSDLIGRIDVVTTMVSANKDLMEQQIRDQEAVATKKNETEVKLDEIVSMSVELEQLKGNLVVKQIEQESAIAALSAEKATAEEDRAKFVAQKEEADRLAAEEAARQAAAVEAARVAAEEEARLASEETARQVAAAQTAPQTEQSTNRPAEPVVEESRQEEVATTPVTETTPAPVVNQPAATQPAPAPAPTPAPAPQLPATTGDVIGIAKQYIGVPYVWGGRTPSGFDCSGFTSYVFSQAYGMNIGATTVSQENAGTQIPVSQAQPGDLLFWGSRGGTYHVGIALGGSSYIHAPEPGQSVKIADFNYFYPSFAVRVAR